MLIGYSMPPVTAIGIAGATWLTADGGAACYDGKPARKARASGTPVITLTFGAAFTPHIIAVLGLSGVAVGDSITATTDAGGTLGGNAATATAVRFADGTVGTWIVTGNTVATSTVKISIGATGTIDIGELVAMPAVTIPLREGWSINTVDSSEFTRTRGAQLSAVPSSAYRSLQAQIAGMSTADTRGGGLANGMDLEKLAVALRGGARCIAIPHYRDVTTKVMDAALTNRTAIYGYASQIPDAANIQRGYFTGQLAIEEIPAA